MFTMADFWLGFVVPAAVAMVVLLLAPRLTHHRLPIRDSHSWGGPVAVGAGFVAGWLALFGWPGFPPSDAIDWLLFLAPPLAVLGTCGALWRGHGAVRILLVGVAVPVSLLLLARPLLNAEQPQIGGLLFAATTLAVVTLVSLDTLAERTSAVRMSSILLCVGGPAAITLMASGSLRLGQIGMLLAATQVGIVLVSVGLGRIALARGTTLVFGTLLAALLFGGHLYAELTAFDAVVLGLAGNLAWFGYRWPKHRPLARGVVQVAAVLALAAVPLVRAWLQWSAAGF